MKGLVLDQLGLASTTFWPPGPQLPPAEAFFYAPERWYVEAAPLKGTRGRFIRGGDGAVRWLRVGGRLYERA